MNDNKQPEQGKIKREGIEQWFEEDGDGLYRFALLRVGDSTLAEDRVQETFLQLLSLQTPTKANRR